MLLKHLCHAKLSFVSVYLLSITALLQDCKSHLGSVCSIPFEGSLQTDQVYEDRGIFDKVLKIVGEESTELVREFKVKLIKAYDNIPDELGLFLVQLLVTMVDLDNEHHISKLVQTNE